MRSWHRAYRCQDFRESLQVGFETDKNPWALLHARMVLRAVTLLDDGSTRLDINNIVTVIQL
jgi:hypothetical protein